MGREGRRVNRQSRQGKRARGKKERGLCFEGADIFSSDLDSSHIPLITVVFVFHTLLSSMFWQTEKEK